MEGNSSSTTMSESPVNDSVFDNTAEDSEDRSSPSADTTPNSELSPPDSPIAKNAALKPEDERANARSLAASLSLEEQVRHFRTKCDPLDNPLY
jgi:beta-glucosidase